MLGTKWYPSWIENEIYSMMDDYTLGMEVYEAGLPDAIADFLSNNTSDIEWQLGCSEWSNYEGGVCSIAWIEDGHIHNIMFNYKKEEGRL